MLDRTKDTKINSGKAPINSSELTSEADTFDAKEKEDELKAQLQKQSSMPDQVVALGHAVLVPHVVERTLLGRVIGDKEELGVRCP